MKPLLLIVVVLMLAAGNLSGALAAFVCPHHAITDKHDACCREAAPAPKEAHCASMPGMEMASGAKSENEHIQAPAFALPDSCEHCFRSTAPLTAPVLAGGNTTERYQRFLKAAAIIVMAPSFLRPPQVLRHLAEHDAPPGGAVRPHVLLNVFLI